MLAIFLLSSLLRRRLAFGQAWSLALLLVLAFNPLALLSSSFWLSFTTLALLLYGVNGRLNDQGLWWKWGRPQWVIAFGLLPLSLWIFSQYSFIGFLANAVAIPWVGFLILPFCLLALLLLFLTPPLAKGFLLIADKSLALLWVFLTKLATLPGVVWQQSLPHYGYVLAGLVGVLTLLLPKGAPGRALGVFFFLPLVFIPVKAPSYGELWFSLLDVGQGLAAVLQTAEHTLVYDTGARLGPALDMGERVVLPFLRLQGLKRIDLMVISHGDNDHSGGALAILQQMPVKEVRTSVPQLFSKWPASYCLAGTAWQWDGVDFKFLYPTAELLNQGNNSSCVLQVSIGSKRILLAGDIEKKAEQFLVFQKDLNLAAELLVAPHHGSKTSGLKAFIARVHPEYVLYAIGYHNRYHFPHPSILKSYELWGAIQYDTATSGALQFSLNAQGIRLRQRERFDDKKYWQLDKNYY